MKDITSAVKLPSVNTSSLNNESLLDYGKIDKRFGAETA